MGFVALRLQHTSSSDHDVHSEIKQESSSSSDAVTADDNDANCAHGFARPTMYKDTLHGTILPYHQHIFLCFGDPSNWPPVIESSSSPVFELPRLLAASLESHKGQLPKKTRFNVCKGSAKDIKSTKGDVLVFPTMLKFKNLGCDEVKGFVEEFLVQDKEWQLDRVEALNGHHIFVCAHGSRDIRCGFCGPILLERFEKELTARGLCGSVHVRACSHVGGHKFAGNVLIYGKDSNSKVKGHWYGYVRPSDVALLLDEHVSKGQIVERLWRGEMTSNERRHQ